MPKRLIDDSFLSSPSLAKCSPRAQDAFPRFILLADDFGCFEVEPRALVGRGWPKRTDVSEDDVRAFLDEYVAAGMACLYTAQERRCCYLTGWNGPHGQKKRAEYDPNAPSGTPGRHGSKRRLPAPPPDLVAAVMAGARRDADGKPPGTDREDTTGIPSDYFPARETAGSRSIPGPLPSVPAAVPEIPGPVVPVPVPDAGETFAPSPSGSAPAIPGNVEAVVQRAASGPIPHPTASGVETPRGPADAPATPGPRAAPLGDESPGPEDAPAESDAAQANAAAPGGSAPAARDGGDAGLPGIGGTPSAPGPARPADLSPVVQVLPCTGTGPREYGVTEAQVAKWQSAFPGVDVRAQLAQMLVWLEANPTKVKTHRGIPAFCVRWLSNEQDKRRVGATASAPARRPGMAPMGSAEAFARNEKPW